MLSPDFLKRLGQIRSQQKRQGQFQKWAKTRPYLFNNEHGARSAYGGRWYSGLETEDQVDRTVYSKAGKAYPNPRTAILDGVTDYAYQIPSGVNVDWSWWDQFKQPLPPEKAAYDITVADQTFKFDPGDAETPASAETTTTEAPANDPPPDTSPEPGPEPEPEEAPEPPDPFAGISAGRLAEAKRYASAGMFGRAKQQAELGGGAWEVGGELSKAFRTGASTANPRSGYGGEFNWQKTDVVGGKTSKAGMESALSKIGSDMKMGAAKAAIEAAGGTWSKRLHVRLQAEKKRREEEGN